MFYYFLEKYSTSNDSSIPLTVETQILQYRDATFISLIWIFVGITAYFLFLICLQLLFWGRAIIFGNHSVPNLKALQTHIRPARTTLPGKLVPLPDNVLSL